MHRGDKFGWIKRKQEGNAQKSFSKQTSKAAKTEEHERQAYGLGQRADSQDDSNVPQANN